MTDQRAYYNDNDPKIAAWLRALIEAELIMDGDVDERSITEVRPSDLDGYTRCHFFAGIGGWDFALQLAGFPADVPIWTGSCPCQSISGAGKRAGEADERHLWPEFYRLIRDCAPPICIGEQTASGDGREWFDGVRLDLDELGYAVGAADLPAACVGSPHKRQRIFWVANASGTRLPKRGGDRGVQSEAGFGEQGEAAQLCSDVSVANAAVLRREGSYGAGQLVQRSGTNGEHCQGGTWDNFDIVECREPDGTVKYRRVESGLEPLVNGISSKLADGTEISKQEMSRVTALRGIGNAIIPQVAAKFIRAFMETTGG